MTHPDPDRNPHAGVFPGLAVDPYGVVLTGFDAEGNPITLTTTAAHTEATEADGAGTDVRTDEGGEQPSASSPAAQDGTARSTSSSTSKKSGSSGGKPSPKPAPDAENPSE